MQRAQLVVLISLILISTPVVACGQGRQIPELPVPPNAYDVRWLTEYDGAVHFRIAEAYPASAFLQFLTMAFTERGWKPDSEDFFDPAIPSSHVRGWTEHGDGDASVFSWIAGWTSPSGGYVQYDLEYRVKSEAVAERRVVEVRALFLSPERASSFRERRNRKANHGDEGGATHRQMATMR